MKVTLMLNEEHYRQFPHGDEILEKVHKNRTGINICGFMDDYPHCYAFVQADSGKTYYVMILSDGKIEKGVGAVRACDNWDVSTMGYVNTMKSTQILKRENGGRDFMKEPVSKYFNLEEVQQVMTATVKEYNMVEKAANYIADKVA